MADDRVSTGEGISGRSFGPNAWLVDDMYEQFLNIQKLGPFSQVMVT